MKKNHLFSVCVIGAWLLALAFLFITGKKALVDLEENGCEMTYMFEYPEYIRIKLKKNVSQKYPRYGLYLYGEGLYAQEQKRSFLPSGIPVLFIPGNAGSYRQVRSLASVALRKAERHRNHFNYFTTDFDEDFSGLYGGVLMGQVHFVHSCLKHIVKMYGKKKSTPVILIGHSMGGMIARALFTLDNFRSKFVSIIITLGTPHVAPVLPLDNRLDAFYFRVNDFWKHSPSISNLSVISLAGGARDILVPAKHCALPRNMDIQLQYSAVTTAVPNVWLTIDHLALCWCKQLILVINRALFALADEDNYSNMITEDKVRQAHVLRQYFGVFHKQNGDTSESRFNQSPSIYNKTNLWNDYQEISISKTLLIPVNTYGDDAQFIAISSSIGDISLLSCQSVENDRCTGSKVLSFQALPKTSRQKAGIVHVTKLTNTSYIKISNIRDRPQLAMQFLTMYSASEQFDKFGIFKGKQKFLSSNHLFMNISLPMIRNCFDAYVITVKKIDCKSDRDGLFTGRIHLPWSQEDVYSRTSQSTEFVILLQIHASKPSRFPEFAQLHVWKTDRCSLDVTLEYQFAQTLSRIFIIYAPLVPQWIYSCTMIVLVFQFELMCDRNTYALCNFISKFLFGCFVWSVSRGLVLYDWAFPSCFVVMSAIVIFLTLCISLEIILSFLAWLILLFSSKHIQSPTKTSTTMTALLYGILGVVIFSLMYFCSPIAIYFLTMTIFIHCCKTTVKYRTSEAKSLDTSEIASNLKFSKLLLVFFLVVSFQTIPAFIVWLKVLSTSLFLPSDPFRTLVLLLIPTSVCSREMRVPRFPTYAAYVMLLVWFVGSLFYSLNTSPYFFGFILLAINFFAFGKHKYKKN